MVRGTDNNTLKVEIGPAGLSDVVRHGLIDKLTVWHDRHAFEGVEDAIEERVPVQCVGRVAWSMMPVNYYLLCSPSVIVLIPTSF